jgi:hypothetical protein
MPSERGLKRSDRIVRTRNPRRKRDKFTRPAWHACRRDPWKADYLARTICGINDRGCATGVSKRPFGLIGRVCRCGERRQYEGRCGHEEEHPYRLPDYSLRPSHRRTSIFNMTLCDELRRRRFSPCVRAPCFTYSDDHVIALLDTTPVSVVRLRHHRVVLMNRGKVTIGLPIIGGSLSTLAIEKSLPADATAKATHRADTS